MTPPALRSSGSLRERGPIAAPFPGSGNSESGEREKRRQRGAALVKGAPFGPTGRVGEVESGPATWRSEATSELAQSAGQESPASSSAGLDCPPPARLWPPPRPEGEASADPESELVRRSSTEPSSPRPPPGQPRRGSGGGGGGSSKARPASVPPPGAAGAAYLLPSRLRPSAPHRGRGGRARGRIRPGLRSRAEPSPPTARREWKGALLSAETRAGPGGAAGGRDAPGAAPEPLPAGLAGREPVLPLGRPPGRLPAGQGSGVLPTESEPSPPRPALPLTRKLRKTRGKGGLRTCSVFSLRPILSGRLPPKGASPSGPDAFRQASVTPSKRGGRPGDRLWPPSPQPLP